MKGRTGVIKINVQLNTCIFIYCSGLLCPRQPRNSIFHGVAQIFGPKNCNDTMWWECTLPEIAGTFGNKERSQGNEDATMLLLLQWHQLTAAKH